LPDWARAFAESWGQFEGGDRKRLEGEAVRSLIVAVRAGELEGEVYRRSIRAAEYRAVRMR
jgi:hypothetical protein